MVLGAFAVLLALEPDLDVVATATDGAAALAAVRAHDPDVLVTDVEMPGATGLEVAAELHRCGARTRLVIVTTFARSGYLRRALEAGVSGYVLQDAPIDQLVETIRRVHAGQRVIDPALAVAPYATTSRPRSPSSARATASRPLGWPGIAAGSDHLAGNEPMRGDQDLLVCTRDD